MRKVQLNPDGTPKERGHALKKFNEERKGLKMDRVGVVSELLMQGKTPSEIFRHVTTQLKWPVKLRALMYYVNEANEIFAKEAAIKAKDEFGKGLRRLNMLFHMALKQDDLKTCLAVQREINIMMGFTNKSILEHTGETKQTTKIQIEYIPSKKVIPTSEEEVDMRRISISVEDAQIIPPSNDQEKDQTTTTPVDDGRGRTDDERTLHEPEPGSESAAPVPGEQTVQEDTGVYQQNDNPPGGYEFF